MSDWPPASHAVAHAEGLPCPCDTKYETASKITDVVLWAGSFLLLAYVVYVCVVIL
jgi:hypothetical protein